MGLFLVNLETISENSHKKHFSLSLVLLKPEILNCRVATLKEKEQFCTKIFLKFWKFWNTLSFLSTSEKVSVVEFLVRRAVDCGCINLLKRNSPTYVFLENFQFLMQLFQNTVIKTSVMEFSRSLGC